jgi:short chain dehydrogenase
MAGKGTVIVTGGSQGIGAAVVQAFLDRGYSVVATSRKISARESRRPRLVPSGLCVPAKRRSFGHWRDGRNNNHEIEPIRIPNVEWRLLRLSLYLSLKAPVVFGIEIGSRRGLSDRSPGVLASLFRSAFGFCQPRHRYRRPRP